MRFGLPISLVLHGGLLAAGLVALPIPQLALPEALNIVPIDLVTLAETTNIKAEAPEPEPETEIAPPLDTPPPPVPEPEPEPEPDPIAPPPSAKPEPEPEPVKEEIAPKPKPIKKTPPPKKKAKPKRPAFDLARLESKLAKQDVPEPPKSKAYEAARAAIGAGDAMTATEIDLLLSEMYDCWSKPSGAPNPERLKVTVRIRLNPNGTLRGTPDIINQSEINRSGDRYWRTAADNARRAVIKCQPYKLPSEKYASWQELKLNFKPPDVLGN